MKKEVFIKAINAIEKQIKLDAGIAEKLGEAFHNARPEDLIPNTETIISAMIEVLQEEMGDTKKDEYGGTWISWFCYDVNFGAENYRVHAYREDESVIPMNNASDLYDYLIENNCSTTKNANNG